MEVTYRVQEGFRLPNLLLPQEAEVHLGKYAELRRQYIKKHRRVLGTVSTIYWLTATAVFLLYTYGPHGNGQPRYSWIIWAVAGVLYAAVMGIVRIISRSRG